MSKRLITLISIFILVTSGCIGSTHIKSITGDHTKIINVSDNNGFFWNYMTVAYINRKKTR